MNPKHLTILGLVLLSLTGQAQTALRNNGGLELHPGTTITVFGDFDNSGIFIDNSQRLTFKGTSAQAISGSSIPTFNSLTINNSAGVTLQQNVNVDSLLVLTAGPLHLNSNRLTVYNGATGAILPGSGYVVSEATSNDSKLTWNIGTNLGLHEFPFGAASGNYVPVVVNATSGNIGNVTVSTYPTPTNNTPFPVSPVAVSHLNNAQGNDMSSATVDRFWQIDNAGATGWQANVTFTAQMSEVGSMVSLNARNWNVAQQQWDQPLAGQTRTSNSATVYNLSSFGSPWILTDSTVIYSITLVTFTAKAVDDHVDLGWVTASEANSDYFEVERSKDLVHYEKVVRQSAAGNSQVTLEYTDVDPDPYGGVSYYRLREVDLDGSSTLSNVVQVVFGDKNKLQLAAYPNPSGGDFQVLVSGAAGEAATLAVFDPMGQLHHLETITLASEQHPMRLGLADKLAKGVYTLRVVQGTQSQTLKIVIQ